MGRVTIARQDLLNFSQMPSKPAEVHFNAHFTARAKASMRRTSMPPLDPLRYAPSAERPVRAKARLLEHDVDIQAHKHSWGQLVFSITGAVRVNTIDATYLVPPARAVWIAPELVHAVTAVERADLRTVYLHRAPADGPGCCNAPFLAALDEGAGAVNGVDDPQLFLRHAALRHVGRLLRQPAIGGAGCAQPLRQQVVDGEVALRHL